MAGQKRTRSGEPKPKSNPEEQQPQDTPPCGQAQPSCSKTTNSKTSKDNTTNDADSTKPWEPRIKAGPWNTYVPSFHGPINPFRRDPNAPVPTYEERVKRDAELKRAYHERRNKKDKNKRPQLPPNATISKRPLLHPAIPTPFASAESPKVLYITASSPFIPTCKRIRSLLVQISKREAQSAASVGRGKARSQRRGKGLEANGRLSAADVEASISAAAAQGSGKSRSVGGEEVYLKATGRAIPRALELGVKFQGEEDCRVRVEMGSVKAIDDVEIKEDAEGEGLVAGEGKGDKGKEEEIPETRIRTLSTVTVCIGLK
ncbi:hypothetical protein BU25DRAFT_470296 [Macroventuria anomochaeta]|uniref:Uncharacterized protein n=1 Tax=Macroventuria anomochaeta TaxID=301207 RepID=A0ACB6SGE5_9PLEO|nr:uncharacterized protein BU25DRAFT_470296 [Macroventuria anomochaeta]KAF2632547.1 hypothetical protein BU25DRAFT_470296 [Macroventuria anomochaeta]